MGGDCLLLDFVWDNLLGPYYLGVLLWIPVLLFLGKELTMGICHNKKRLDGKIAIVTGANAGL
jgi:hypothetical protein